MPLLADISVPWIVVAMIFISFLRYILERGKAGGLEQELDEPGSPRPTARTGVPGTPSVPPPPTAAEEFRRLLETLREEAAAPAQPPAPPAPPAPVRRTPPPLPVATPPSPSAALPAPAVPPDAQRKAAAFRTHSQSPSKARRASAAAPSLSALLRNPASMRNAVLLREVLGPPLALRPREEPWG